MIGFGSFNICFDNYLSNLFRRIEQIKMKVLIVFALFLAFVSAFPSGELEPSVQTDLKPQQQEEDHKNDLSSVDAKPQGDHEESAAERAKRFIYVSVLPFFQPFVYSVATPVAAPVSSQTTSSTSYTSSAIATAAAAPVSVAATPVGYQPIVRVQAPFVNVVV